MCDKHSFVMDKAGRCYNGGGFTESHSLICAMWGLKEDQVNAYEWIPPHVWPCEDWTAGFKKDQINFEEKSSHVDALERYIKQTFPTHEAWKNYRNYELHGMRFKDNGQDILITCKKELAVIKDGELCLASGSATVEAYDSATVEANESATVEAYDSATVEAYDSATVRASGSATVRAYDSATVRAYDSATVIKPYSRYDNAAKVHLAELAVLIDRSEDNKVVVQKASTRAKPND